MNYFIVALFIVAVASQECGLFTDVCDETSLTQAVFSAYEGSNYPFKVQMISYMFAAENCGDTDKMLKVDIGVAVGDCYNNATDTFDYCSIQANATGQFTMVSNAKAAAMMITCTPALADGESIDILTSTTKCTAAGMDIINIFKLTLAELTKGLPMSMKRDGNKMYLGDMETSYTYVDNTGCNVPTEAPTSEPTTAPTTTPTTTPSNAPGNNTGMTVFWVILVIVILGVAGYFGYTYYKKNMKKDNLITSF